MATLEQNIQIIKNEGVYAKDVRTAIADAILQVPGAISEIANAAVSNINNRAIKIQKIVDSRELFIDMVKSSDDMYTMKIKNGT